MSRGQYVYNRVPSVSIQRSVFGRSHNYKTTLKGDYLYPVYVDEVLPGDSVKINVNLFARMATQVVPLMDNVYIDVFAFFVPERLVWEHWQNFMGEKTGPSDITTYLSPVVLSQESARDTTDNGFAPLSIYDYMGIAVGKSKTWVRASFLRAYNLIYDEWFRDENLIDMVGTPTGDGPDYQSDYKLLKRAKAHDYFTSALPWPQKGPASMIDIAGTAPVYGNGFGLALSVGSSLSDIGTVYSSSQSVFYGGPTADVGKSVGFERSSTSTPISDNKTIGVATKSQLGDNLENSGLVADLGGVEGISINQLRMSYQFQRLLERDARSGTRYTEILRAHFGVVSPDARLQRPEFLGMFSSKVGIQAIAQNSSTDATTPQGNLAAIGVASGSSKPIVKSFVEHGVIMFLANVRGDINYDQGMDKKFSRLTRNDFYWPAYAHLGEQAILNKEIYCQGESVKDAQGNIVDDQVFGYIGRFDEYRTCKNEVTAELRGSYSQSLNYWTLVEEFANLPGLNKTFIEQNTPFQRSQAVSSDPTFIVDIFFKSRWARPMPTFGVPGWVDHF